MRTAIANEPIATDSGVIRTTLSLGVGITEGEAVIRLDDLISSADSALYKAKGRGAIVWLLLVRVKY